jgi:anhydro-N-acetylmuramic acid kinase
MVYKVIGIMSGSSLDGLDIVYTELQEKGGSWNFTIMNVACVPYEAMWEQNLREAETLSAKDYLLLHTAYGHYTGKKVNEFIRAHNLQHQVDLVASHGHTVFHMPENKMTHQLGEGAAIAAETHLPVVCDLRSLDIAFGGQGAPIVPTGEKLLFSDFSFFLNIGGIANVSIRKEHTLIAFDVCPANRVLNMLAGEMGLAFDDQGHLSSQGSLHEDVLQKLNNLEYYTLHHPKSLANSFGTGIVYPLLQSSGNSIQDNLRTFTEHICIQLKHSLLPFKTDAVQKLFVTGGGAFNTFLLERLRENLGEINFEIFVPEADVVKYKEALIMAQLGTLRWREQNTVVASVTGALRNSIGGALWLGTEA